MLRPVTRRSEIVVLAILLIYTAAFSHDRNEYFEYQDRVDDEDLEPYLVNDSEDKEELSQRAQEFLNNWESMGDFSINTDNKPSMMDTYEKFKRQAVKTVVPGDETMHLTEGGSAFSKLNSLVSWQTATLISVLCVAAVIGGVILGVAYWPKTAFGERRDSSATVSQSAGDRSLAHSAQMYHYQQQKQQMLAMDQAAGRVRSLSSNSESEGECEEPDVNVYECPGLATASEEVKNPLYENNQGGNSAGSSTKDSKKD